MKLETEFVTLSCMNIIASSTQRNVRVFCRVCVIEKTIPGRQYRLISIMWVNLVKCVIVTFQNNMSVSQGDMAVVVCTRQTRANDRYNISQKFQQISKFWNFIIIFEISVRHAFK